MLNSNCSRDFLLTKVERLTVNTFLFYLKKNRSASVVLSEQNKKIKNGTKDTIDRLHKIKDMGLQSKKILEHGRIDDFGEILHEHWLIKKGLTDVGPFFFSNIVRSY